MPKKTKSAPAPVGMTVKTVPLDSLHLDPANARLHGEKNLDAIKASLKEFGQVEALVCARDGKIIGGNGRYEAMRSLGWTHAAVNYVDASDIKQTSLGIALNRTAELAEWDHGVLESLLTTLKDSDVDVASLGYDDTDMTTLAEQLNGDATATEHLLDADALTGDDDDAEPSAGDTTTQPGDIWQVGSHRLMCGDSTNQEHVAALMNGERATLLFTSPPYAQQRDYKEAITDWDSLMCGVFGNVHLCDDAQILVNLGIVHRDGEWLPYWEHWIAWMRTQGWRRFGWYVWDQGAGLAGDWHGRCAPSHEFVFHFNKKPVQVAPTKATKHPGRITKKGGLRTTSVGSGNEVEYRSGSRMTGVSKVPDSVFRINRYSANSSDPIKHPAMFPVALPAEFMAAFSQAGDVCYEPFCGSGTSLLAAEQLSRRCFAMELAPAYCDVALRRWSKLTGQDPILVSGPDDATGNATAAG